jgi:hypothetical protein
MQSLRIANIPTAKTQASNRFGFGSNATMKIAKQIHALCSRPSSNWLENWFWNGAERSGRKITISKDE